jgi:DNA-directed RNA polymerase subunit alpha
LNLKGINFKKTSKEPTTVTLNVSKPGIVKAKDIKVTNDVEILNPDHYITTIDADGKLEIDITIEKGVGYVPANSKETSEVGVILVDSVFSPVKKVKFEVESTRVGQMTNLDKLVLEIETNGAITPADSLKFASNILKSYFNLFNEENIEIESEFMSDPKKITEKTQEKEPEKPKQMAYTPIEILGFSPRTLNALINGGIGSIEELCQTNKGKLSNLRGFGSKALTEVEDALSERGLTIAED